MAREAVSGLCACLLMLVGVGPIAGCASGYGGDDAGHGGGMDTGVRDSGPQDTGPPRDGGPDAGPRDTGPMPDTGPPRDTGVHDSGPTGTDAATPCGTMFCTGFTHCVSGTCMAYPMCRGDGTCPTPGDVCVALRCVPGTVDIDGDGSPASMDCDETDPTRSPLVRETCNNRDDNCNMMIDDGDPTALCMSDPHHGICMMGTCGCPANTADIDLTVPGCECTAHPNTTDGAACDSAVSLGTVFDEASGGTQMLTVMGNAVPDREVWYRFHATDVADTACDHYNVHVAFTANPMNAFEFQVIRGTCSDTSMCQDCTGTTCMNFSDYHFAVNSQMGMTGQCPCSPTPSDTVNSCLDDSADYFVRVRRHAGTPATCMQYTLTVTNGLP